MSEDTNVVQFPGAKATDTLVAQTVRVTIGEGDLERNYVLATYCLAKTLRVFALMTELAQAAGVTEVIASADQAAQNGEFSQGAIAPGFIRRALAILPVALSKGTPALYRLLGLLVTKNSELRRWEDAEEDIDAHLLSIGRDIAYTATNEQIITLITTSVRVLGVETILQQIPNLMPLLARN